MFSTVISWLADSISFAYSVFVSFISDSFMGLFISMFTILLVYRMILKPILGGSLGSDKVSKASKRSQSEDE